MAFNILDREQRRSRIELLENRIRLLRDLRKTTTLATKQLETLLADMEDVARLKRVDRAEVDALFFMYEYFSDERNPGNENNLIPEGVQMADAPDFHRELCDVLNTVSTKEVNARIGYAAPRGHAKSAYLSNMFPVKEIVFRRRKYVLIISETDDISKKFLEWISQQLKHNEKLRADFGEQLSPRKVLNEKDNQEAILTMDGILVEIGSTGKRLRGRRNKSHRPDLVIMDDLESTANTNTPDLRAKNLHWMSSVVMPIGDPDKTAFLFMGTIVHGSGLLPEVLRRGDFKSKKFAAIAAPPERDDLWQRFEEIYRDVENPNRREDALDFYDDNKDEMDRGCRVLWDQRWSYANLILEKVDIGSRAFGSEYMNNPIDEESQIFVPSRFTYFDYADVMKDGRYIPMDFYQFWDISIGKNDRADYNAIITVGRDRRTGVLYVIDAWLAKVPAHKALEVAVEKIIEFRPKVFGVEVVQAQYDFYRQLREALTKRSIYNVKLKPVTPRSKKEDRIEMLEPLVENGILRFMKSQRLLIEQLEQFPNADYDDGPDCLAGAIDLCGTTRRRTFTQKPSGL